MPRPIIDILVSTTQFPNILLSCIKKVGGSFTGKAAALGALKQNQIIADNNPDTSNLPGGLMELRSDKKFFKQTPLLILSLSSLLVIGTCAYYGFRISGFGGATFGAFLGMTICLC
jgi:hypothetical protein